MVSNMARVHLLPRLAQCYYHTADITLAFHNIEALLEWLEDIDDLLGRQLGNLVQWHLPLENFRNRHAFVDGPPHRLEGDAVIALLIEKADGVRNIIPRLALLRYAYLIGIGIANASSFSSRTATSFS